MAEKRVFRSSRHSKNSNRKNPFLGRIYKGLKTRLIPENAPFGMKALIVYALLMTLLYAFYFFIGLDIPLAVMFGKTLEGSAAFFVNLFSVIIFATVLYGLIKRKKWCYYLTLLWFFFNMLNSLCSAFIRKDVLFQAVEQISLISFFTVILINSFIIWYVIEQRGYFFEPLKKLKHKKVSHKEKIFVSILAGFWIIVLIVGLIVSAKLYFDMTSKVDGVMSKLISMSPDEAKKYCESSDESIKDICYVVLATIRQIDNRNSIAQVCNNIKSNFYRYTCYRAAI